MCFKYEHMLNNLLHFLFLILVLDVPGAPLACWNMRYFFCGAIYQINGRNIIVVKLYLVFNLSQMLDYLQVFDISQYSVSVIC